MMSHAGISMEAQGETMSKWRHGCGKKFTVFVPRGYSYREMEVECGSTAYDGGVNQCGECDHKPMPVPDEDESDMDYFERTEGGDE